MDKAKITELVKESIRVCLEYNPGYKKTDSLIITTYNALISFYVDNTKYVLLSAPTGQGKSIIGQLIHFCCCYIDDTIAKSEPITIIEGSNSVLSVNSAHTYFLTSSKILQDQLESDFGRFQIYDYFSMLKGTSNYECTKMTKQNKSYTNYTERFCLGMKKAEKEQLDCFPSCPYLCARFEASVSSCSVLNYSYFLNVMKMKINPFFSVRPLTISDEAHLVPDIVLDSFNITLTMYNINKVNKIYDNMILNFKKLLTNNGQISLNGLGIEPLLIESFMFFSNEKVSLLDITLYLTNYKKLLVLLGEQLVLYKNDKVFIEMFYKDVHKLIDDNLTADYGDYIKGLTERPEDLFIESEFITNFVFKHKSYKIFKYKVYDLSEAEMCKKNFLSKVKRGLFMSATLGNIDEFALLMGMQKNEYTGFRLESNFNFDKSPINIVNSGYLNYANFTKNIPKIVFDTLKICEELHPKEKGIIHTSTFVIANLLKEEIYKRGLGYGRYLFYENSEEKEFCINRMKNEKGNYVIIGPSLYEGLDLKQETGRFNIVMKAPYSGLSDYIRKKMERYPFWYERKTLEKLVQAIGRTNREIDDFSVTYLLDSSLDKLIFKTPEFVTKRIKYFKL